MTQDTIFYLASTVAQTIASLAGFLGAFVLFHLQRRQSALTEYGLLITEQQQPAARLRSAASVGDHAAVLDGLRSISADYPVGSSIAHVGQQLTRQATEYQRILDARNSPIGFRRAMVWTAPLLVASLVMITFAPSIAG